MIDMGSQKFGKDILCLFMVCLPPLLLKFAPTLPLINQKITCAKLCLLTFSFLTYNFAQVKAFRRCYVSKAWAFGRYHRKGFEAKYKMTYFTFYFLILLIPFLQIFPSLASTPIL